MFPARWRKRATCLVAIAALLFAAAVASAQEPSPQTAATERAAPDRLRGGWYLWDPYQYREFRRGVPVLTGFDVEMERALARVLGVELQLSEIAWSDHQAALQAGSADIAAGATETEARRAYALFSKPYRSETDVLVLRKGMSQRYPFRSIDEMLATFARQKFRLGVVTGFVYADPRINAFIADPANREFIVATNGVEQNLRNLMGGVTDGFLADRIAAATAAWRRQQGALIEEHPLQFSTDIHFMLSRAAQTPQMLARVDAAIDQLRESGELRRIAAFYALPVLINQSIDTDWFRFLAVVGTIAFALSGVVLAYAGQYSLFGALILAALPTVGGGVIRDLLLQRDTIGVVRNPQALLIVFATVMVGMLVIRLLQDVRVDPLARHLKKHAHIGVRIVELCDALGLAAFTVVSVVVVLDTAARPIWLWGPVAAAIGGSFGGLMRDLFRHDRVVTNLRGAFYPEIAVIWGLAFTLFLEWEGERLQPDEIKWGVIVAIVGCFLTRLVAIFRGWRGWSYA
ncbi:MAG: transporter substrate-binding domain-containing protein [Alphaproteobacteria bacterium]|nr:transporter substrate-binding domain-containing protein [Alphaproteobacteria bacterium]